MEVSFDIKTPLDDDTLRAHVRHALALDLPELRDFEYPWREPLTMVASGPSGRSAPLDGKSLAINNALKLFTDAGTAPTYWVGCDPQEYLSGFLDDAPEPTTYLVASKCHPSVFERLRGKNVVLWHVDDTGTRDLLRGRDALSRTVSVTLVAFQLMARLGFRDFHIWGWDGCVMDGKENANPQANAPTFQKIEVEGTVYESTTTWALEAQEATHYLRGFPFPIHVHGGGMTGEILRLFRPMRTMTDRAASVTVQPPAQPVF